jgi:hypothetical protein
MALGNEMPPTGRAASTGAGLQLMNALYQYEPTFTPLLAQKRKQVMGDFASSSTGKAGGQLLALNTMIHHADLYLDVADSLKNHTFRPGNAVYNAVATAFGKAPPTEANLVGRFLASETGKVATGGVPAEGEINGLLKSLSTDNSPEQIKKVGSKILQIASGRMVPLKEKAEDAHLTDNGLVTIIGPDAKRILQKRGFDPETMKPVGGGSSGAQPLPTTLTAGDKGKIFVNRKGETIKVIDVNPANSKQFKYEVVK